MAAAHTLSQALVLPTAFAAGSTGARRQGARRVNLCSEKRPMSAVCTADSGLNPRTDGITVSEAPCNRRELLTAVLGGAMLGSTLAGEGAASASASPSAPPLAFMVMPEEGVPEPGGCMPMKMAPSGLSFCDTTLGVGVAAEPGMLIKAHYTGMLASTMEPFDSSYNRGRPLVFRVGVGEVIKGWDQGIAGAEGVPPMMAGGRRTLQIPASLGYGERGAGCRGGNCVIPPNSTLIFEVEFLGKV